MSSSESDSDSDSVEEFQVKRYLIETLQERLQQAKAQKRTKTGIKRQPGHYHLSDRRHAVLPSQEAYSGNHWDVAVPLNLQRSTPRLTRYAIRKATFEEQESQIQCKNRDLAAHAANDDLIKEFDDVIVFNCARIAMEQDKQRSKLELTKDSVQCELFRKKFCEDLVEEEEHERQYRLKLLYGLRDNSMRTPSTEDLVSGMANTNYKRTLINTDIEEAQSNIERNEDEIDTDYTVAMNEMLDESLGKVIHTFATTETMQLFEEEKRRRLSEKGPNAYSTLELKHLKLSQKELQSIFEEVVREEAYKEELYKGEVSDRKTFVQEQLLRAVAKKLIEKAEAEERARRIREESESGDDPARNAMRHLVTRVQRQMLLQKFKGKWINLARKPKQEKRVNANETERDRKLRQQRESQRRALSVRRGDDSD